MVGCGESDMGFGTNPNTDNYIEPDGTMVLSVEELIFEEVGVGLARSETVVVKNGGDTVLTLRSATVVDGCWCRALDRSGRPSPRCCCIVVPAR